MGGLLVDAVQALLQPRRGAPGAAVVAGAGIHALPACSPLAHAHPRLALPRRLCAQWSYLPQHPRQTQTVSRRFLPTEGVLNIG